ncbi:hypothetical protein HYC85_013484 [Camellia sinensis]|uniref:PPM-type phosphatase domain-containing protein n=1 Tax=Camellia sinensis TaxID=4442 RepID=A0A7J7H4Q3_CAMSI|nr:hypothetical protein HYC85_013484 [Camellia sinensis]
MGPQYTRQFFYPFAFGFLQPLLNVVQDGFVRGFGLTIALGCLRFDPFREVICCDDQVSLVSWGPRQWSYDIEPPLGERPGTGDRVRLFNRQMLGVGTRFSSFLRTSPPSEKMLIKDEYILEKVGLGSSADTGKGKSKMSKHPDFWTETEDAVQRAYRTTDTSILDKSVELGKWGSTAVTAILIDCHKLVVANVGDSRAVACKDGVAKQLSVDHEPSKERTYIEDRGGFVSNFQGSTFKRCSETDGYTPDISYGVHANTSRLPSRKDTSCCQST